MNSSMHSLGMLGVLPAEVRNVIYEYLIPPKYISRQIRSRQRYCVIAFDEAPAIVHDVAIVQLMQTCKTAFTDVKPTLDRYFKTRPDVLEYVRNTYSDKQSGVLHERDMMFFNSAAVFGIVPNDISWQGIEGALHNVLHGVSNLEIYLTKDYSRPPTPQFPDYKTTKFTEKLSRCFNSARGERTFANLEKVKVFVDLNVQETARRLQLSGDAENPTPQSLHHKLTQERGSIYGWRSSVFSADVSMIIDHLIPSVRSISRDTKVEVSFRCSVGLRWGQLWSVCPKLLKYMKQDPSEDKDGARYLFHSFIPRDEISEAENNASYEELRDHLRRRGIQEPGYW